MIGHLRRNFPATVTSETVKKFALAPNNESYVVNALQFLRVIDEQGKRTEKGHDVFVLGDDAFPEAFGDLVKEAYNDLFEIRGDGAWTLPRNDLISYFRTTDKTSEVIGGRQAKLFQTFAALAGHATPDGTPSDRESKVVSRPKKGADPRKAKPSSSGKGATSKSKVITPPEEQDLGKRNGMALTVRIEINLPANGTKETYDNIFQSIRANLINE